MVLRMGLSELPPSLPIAPGMPPSGILVIDDDAALLEGLAQMLRIRLQPVQIDTCHGSALALTTVRQGRYDVILCDLWMPGIDGLELLPHLRQAAPEAIILMMSAVLDDRVKERAVAGGAMGFLVKPFDRDGLTMTLKQVLQQHSLPRRTAV